MVGTFMSFKQTLSVFNRVLDNFQNGKMEISNRDVALLEARGSLVRFLSTFIIEPTIVISRNLREEEITEKLAAVNVDIFAAFYVQAFNVMTNVYGYNQKVAFDTLSSSGGLMPYTATKQDALTMENIFSLEDLNTLPISQAGQDYVNFEALDSRPGRGSKNWSPPGSNKNTQSSGGDKSKKDSDSKKDDRKSGGGSKDSRRGPTARAVYDKESLVPSLLQKSVEMEYTIDNNGDKITIVIPILIKATVIYTSSENISTMIDTNGRDKKFSSRLDEYRAGAIALSDMAFANDLVETYKKNKLKDKDDLIKHMEDRATRANKELVAKGHIGFSKFYGILIVSKRELAGIENLLGGKIEKPKYKERLMDQTKSMLLSVVDTDWERVSMYTKDLRGSTDITYKTLSKRKKDDGSDLTEIFKAVMANKTPQF